MSVYSFRGARSTRRLLIEILALAVVVCVSAWLLTTITATNPEPGTCQAAEPIKLAGPARHRSFEAPREKAIRTYAESYGLSIEEVRRAVYRLDYEIAD